MTGDDCEELARRESAASTMDRRERVNARAFAAGYLGLRLRPKPGADSHLRRGGPGRPDTIIYDPTEPLETRAFMIFHECAHWLIGECGWRLDRELEERCASRIAAALLLPRRAYLDDLRDHGRDLVVLRERWPHASAWIHARRQAELSRDGLVASRWRGRKVERVVTDNIEAGRGPTAIERALSRAVLAGETIDHDSSSAWVDGDGAAIVLCPVDDLGRGRSTREARDRHIDLGHELHVDERPPVRAAR